MDRMEDEIAYMQRTFWLANNHGVAAALSAVISVLNYAKTLEARIEKLETQPHAAPAAERKD